MNKIFLITFFAFLVGQIEDSFAMKCMTYSPQDHSPREEKKIVRKGFKPPQQSPVMNADKSPSRSPSHRTETDSTLLYDPERNMYYYGVNLSDAAKAKDIKTYATPSTEDENKVVFSLKKD